jgi:hypothetical protein
MTDDLRDLPVPRVTCGCGHEMNHVQRFAEDQHVLDQFICPSCKANAGVTHDRIGPLVERRAGDSVTVRFEK